MTRRGDSAPTRQVKTMLRDDWDISKHSYILNLDSPIFLLTGRHHVLPHLLSPLRISLPCFRHRSRHSGCLDLQSKSLGRGLAHMVECAGARISQEYRILWWAVSMQPICALLMHHRRGSRLLCRYDFAGRERS